MNSASWQTISGTKTLMTAAKDKINGVSNMVNRVTKETKARASKVTASSNLGKFFGIQEASRSSTDDLLTTFIKLHNKQNPSMRMNMLSLEKMKSLVEEKERVGFPEMAKLMSTRL